MPIWPGRLEGKTENSIHLYADKLYCAAYTTQFAWQNCSFSLRQSGQLDLFWYEMISYNGLWSSDAEALLTDVHSTVASGMPSCVQHIVTVTDNLHVS